MRAIKCYVYSYPLWFRIVILIATPAVCFVMLLNGVRIPKNDTLPMYFAYWAAMYTCVTIYSEFYAMSGLYKKAEPFGSMLLSSTHALSFMRAYVVTDCLSRIIHPVVVFTLPALVTGCDPIFILKSLILSFVIAAVTLSVIYINRRADNNLLLLVLSIAAIALVSIAAILMITSSYGMSRYCFFWAAAVTLCAALGYLSVRFGIKRLERSFYDDRD